MKQFLTIIGIFLFSNLSFGQNQVGIALVTGSHTFFKKTSGEAQFGLGLQAKYQYKLNEKMVIAPSATYIPASNLYQFSLHQYEFGIDLQYDFIDNEMNRGYAIVSPMFKFFDVINNDVDGVSETFNLYNQLGLGLGFGVEQGSNFTQELILQYKPKELNNNKDVLGIFDFAEENQFQVYVKIGYTFNVNKKKQEPEVELEM